MDDSVLEMNLAIGNVERSEELGVGAHVEDVAHDEEKVTVTVIVMAAVVVVVTVVVMVVVVMVVVSNRVSI